MKNNEKYVTEAYIRRTLKPPLLTYYIADMSKRNEIPYQRPPQLPNEQAGTAMFYPPLDCSYPRPLQYSNYYPPSQPDYYQLFPPNTNQPYYPAQPMTTPVPNSSYYNPAPPIYPGSSPPEIRPTAQATPAVTQKQLEEKLKSSGIIKNKEPEHKPNSDDKLVTTDPRIKYKKTAVKS